MKTFKIIKKVKLVVLFAFVALFSACSRNNGTPDPGNSAGPAGSFITTKIEGANYSSAKTALSSTIASRQGSGASTFISLLGVSTTSTGSLTESITINLLGITAPGTYALTLANKDTASLGYSYAPTGGTAIGYSTGDCSASTGTIVITSLSSTQIEGTFTCTTKKVTTCDVTKTFAEGSFKGIF